MKNSWTRRGASKFNNKSIKELFCSDEIAPIMNAAQMDFPLNKEEVMKGAVKLTNSKSSGKYGIYPKLLKHAPEEYCKKISNILNNMARTEEYPLQLKSGILPLLAVNPPKMTSTSM